jgi:hypothetical protein
MDPVVHFEMPYEDQARMVDFYAKTFGWKANVMGPEMGNYVVVQTGEVDANNMLKETGRINGGLYKKSDRANFVSVVIAVKNLAEATEKVKAAGGQVLGGSKGDGTPDDISGVGLYSSIIDTEGNHVGMLEPKGM